MESFYVRINPEFVVRKPLYSPGWCGVLETELDVVLYAVCETAVNVFPVILHRTSHTVKSQQSLNRLINFIWQSFYSVGDSWLPVLDGKMHLRIDAAALLSQGSFVWLLFVFLLIGGSTYSGLAKGTSCLSLVSQQGRCRSPYWTEDTRRHQKRHQKWGCRAGIQKRLRKDLHRPALANIFLTNVRFLSNKVDKLALTIRTYTTVRNCSIHCMKRFLVDHV